MFIIFFCLLNLIITQIVLADCSPFHFYQQNVQFFRQVPNDKTCWLSVNPDGKRLIYRSYLLDQDGLFMIFNSYGNGPNTTHTGARVFYFLPIGPQLPQVRSHEKSVTVITSSSLMLDIDTQSGRWISISDGQIREDLSIRRDNQGGIEFFDLKKRILLDAGFSLGRDPRWNPNGYSQLTDGHKQTCQIHNHLIYQYDDQGDIQMRYPQMFDLYQFLIIHCPHLDLSAFEGI